MPSPGIANLLPQLNGTPILGEEARSSIQDILKRIIPGWAAIDAFYSSWLNLDLTTLAAVLTVFGTVGSAVRDLRDVSLKLYWWITTFFTASISINGNDRLNREVINWLGANVLTRQGTRILTASSETINNDSWSWRYRPVERTDYHHEKRLPVTYLPTFGTTWFIHKYRLFMVKRIPKTSAYRADMPEEFASAPRGDEPLVIMCLGRSVDPIKGFLDTCRSFADAQRESFTTVRAARSEYNMECWDTTILRPIRPIETVHFDEKLKAELVSDIRSYLDVSTRKFYNARGIPYRRGYLLHGPPGTGKTSLSLALAGHFGLDLYILHIPSVREDREVEKLFTALPPQCLILLEDIDAVGMKRRALKDADEADDSDSDGDDDDVAERLTHCRCTLSGLLNILDGVAAQEGRIVLMTSNVADSLDPALVRPGRIDRIIYLGEISRESARLMFLRMYDGEEDGVSVVHDKSGAELAALASEFAAGIAERYFTPAQVQGFLLRYRGDAVGAAREVRRWAEEEGRVMEEARAKSRRVAEARARRKERRKERRRARKAEDAERALALAERRKRKGAGAGGGDNEEAEGEEEGEGEVNGTKEGKVNGEKKGEAENGKMTGREEEKKESGEKENGDKSEAVEAKENGET